MNICVFRVLKNIFSRLLTTKLECNNPGSEKQYMIFFQQQDHRNKNSMHSHTHVRISDIKGHGHRKYCAIKEYIDNIYKVNRAKMHENILLFTDDQNTIEEATHREYPEDDKKGMKEGGKNHFPSGNPKTEVIMLLAESKAAKYCVPNSRQEGNFGKFLLAHKKWELPMLPMPRLAALNSLPKESNKNLKNLAQKHRSIFLHQYFLRLIIDMSFRMSFPSIGPSTPLTPAESKYRHPLQMDQFFMD